MVHKKTRVASGLKRGDSELLKKFSWLLALCGFVLIPAFIISPAQDSSPPPPASPVSTSVGEVEIAAHVDTLLDVLLQPKQVIFVTVTAYSSTEDQTDQTPFHTANGEDVKDGIVATNFLPFGTLLRIPGAFGDKIFTVQDRMHERFDRRIDIWMPTRESAQAFGIRYLKIEIFS